MGHNSETGKTELWFVCSAHHLMVLYISVKFHENISNVFHVTAWTRFCDGQMDGWMDGQTGKNNMSPHPDSVSLHMPQRQFFPGHGLIK